MADVAEILKNCSLDVGGGDKVEHDDVFTEEHVVNGYVENHSAAERKYVAATASGGEGSCSIYNENAMITINNDNEEATTTQQDDDNAVAKEDNAMPKVNGAEEKERNTSSVSGSRGEWDFIDSMDDQGNGRMIKKMVRSQENQIRFMRAEIHTKNELIDSLLKIINVLMEEQKNRRDTVYVQPR